MLRERADLELARDFGYCAQSIPFHKMVAAGNDFVVINQDQSDDLLPPDLAAFSRQVCNRQFGAGADGLLLIERIGPVSIRLTVLNPDGSAAKMCGNGARCAALYALLVLGVPAPVTVRLNQHEMQAWITDGRLEVTSPQPAAIEGPVRLLEHDLYLLNSGTEYAVAFVADVQELQRIDVNRLGSAIRYHPYFAPAGTSVSFIAPDGADLRVRTYERGNEEETLSCGSAAVADVVAARQLGMVADGLVAVHNRTEHPLLVRIDGATAPFRQLTLIGPARISYCGML
jgi:diaminopimelate epimerase